MLFTVLCVFFCVLKLSLPLYGTAFILSRWMLGTFFMLNARTLSLCLAAPLSHRLILRIVIISHKQNTYSHELSSFQFHRRVFLSVLAGRMAFPVYTLHRVHLMPIIFMAKNGGKCIAKKTPRNTLTHTQNIFILIWTRIVGIKGLA